MFTLIENRWSSEYFGGDGVDDDKVVAVFDTEQLAEKHQPQPWYDKAQGVQVTYRIEGPIPYNKFMPG